MKPAYQIRGTCFSLFAIPPGSTILAEHLLSRATSRLVLLFFRPTILHWGRRGARTRACRVETRLNTLDSWSGHSCRRFSSSVACPTSKWQGYFLTTPKGVCRDCLAPRSAVIELRQ